MGFFIFIVVTLFLLIDRKTKIVFFLSFLYLWFVFGWCSYTPDMEIYRWRYEEYDSEWMEMITEPGYSMAMGMFHKHGFHLPDIYIFISFFFLLSLYFYVYKSTKNRSAVIGLILISIYPLLVTLLRTTFAFTLDFIAFYILINYETKIRFLFFSLLIVLATQIHSLSILYLVFMGALFIKGENLNKIVLIALGCSQVAITLASVLMPDVMAMFDMTEKTEQFMEDTEAEANKLVQFLLAVFRILSVVIIPFGIQFILKKKNIVFSNKEKVIMDMNKVGLLVIPLLVISHDLYRVFFVFAVINFCFAANYMKNKRCFWFTLLAACNVGYWFIWRPYFEQVFYSVYTRNYLLCYL